MDPPENANGKFIYNASDNWNPDFVKNVLQNKETFFFLFAGSKSLVKTTVIYFLSQNIHTKLKYIIATLM